MKSKDSFLNTLLNEENHGSFSGNAVCSGHALNVHADP